MGYHPRIELSEHAYFNTIRRKNSRLWFVNNPKLEKQILSYVAKYSTVHNAELYAIAIESNHIQDLANFPNENRSDFIKDRNSAIAKLVIKNCLEHKGAGSPLFAKYDQWPQVCHFSNPDCCSPSCFAKRGE